MLGEKNVPTGQYILIIVIYRKSVQSCLMMNQYNTYKNKCIQDIKYIYFVLYT